MIETSPQRRYRSYWLLAAIGLAAAAAVITATWWHPTPSATRPAATVAAHAPLAIGAGPWERVALPAPAADIGSLAVAPDDASTLYACAAYVNVILWRTTDAGAHWTRYGPPLARGTACTISVAPDNPARVGVEVATAQSQGQPCADTTLYLSDDRGATWRELAPHVSAVPADATFIWCQLQVTARHLFLLDSFDTSSAAHQTTLLERSDDDGAHWTRADDGLASGSLFTSLLVGPNDTMATLVLHAGTAQTPYETDLLISRDGVRTWDVWSQAPEPIGTALLGARPNAGGQWPSAGRPFYALSSEQIPSDLYREGIFATTDGRGWDQLPTLPVSGVSAERRGILQVLAALPDGRLAAWGADPRAGVPTFTTVPQTGITFWLWLWNPTAHEWQVIPTPLAATQDVGCGALCWYADTAADRAGATYLYVSNYVLSSMNSSAGLFRIRLARRP